MKTRPLTTAALMAVCVLAPVELWADLEPVKAEKKLEKRSRLALENADSMFDAAREAYQSGNPADFKAALMEVRESIEIAYQSLVDTGKKPRSNASHYKRGEINTRQLLRRMVTFQKGISYLDRDQVEPVIQAIEKIHDRFLLDVMGGGK